ncbi:MAG: sigma-70 family RNA polymerase sigma factor [Candidatus Omnitrophica bacterium]|nr:sigma-70 family RNA polymerase sigma factor [Candidatus Omnitrophota bacterium]
MDGIKSYISQIRSTPLLTAKEEISLSNQIKKGNKKARKKMISANLLLVINIAKRYGHLGMPLMDMIEEGNIGLMKAVEKFDPRKGYRFSTYAGWWIKQSITRAIAEQVKLIRTPVYLNELLVKWKKTNQRLSQKLKRQPSDQEIAKKMKISKNRAEQVMGWLSMQTSSLDAPIGEDGQTQVSDLVEDESTKAPDEDITRLMFREKIHSLLDDLMSERERRVLDMRFGLISGSKQTLAEIADKLGVSRERIRQIEEQALKKLKKFVNIQDRENGIR